MKYSPVYTNNGTLTKKFMDKGVRNNLEEFRGIISVFANELGIKFLNPSSNKITAKLEFINELKDKQLSSIEQVSVDYIQKNELWRLKFHNGLYIFFVIQRSTFNKNNVEIEIHNIRFIYKSLTYWLGNTLESELGIRQGFVNTVHTFLKIVWNYSEHLIVKK